LLPPGCAFLGRKAGAVPIPLVALTKLAGSLDLEPIPRRALGAFRAVVILLDRAGGWVAAHVGVWHAG
jgi:hypothetical protein